MFGTNGFENWKGRRFHNKELHHLYHSPYIVSVIKSRRLGWAEYIARMKKRMDTFKILAV